MCAPQTLQSRGRELAVYHDAGSAPQGMLHEAFYMLAEFLVPLYACYLLVLGAAKRAVAGRLPPPVAFLALAVLVGLERCA